MSGRLSDWIVGVRAKKSRERDPALRLMLSYPSAFITAIGYTLWGVSVDRDWHWMVSEISLFLGKLIST